MRFLLDEGISPRVVDLLGAAGHDVVHVRGIGLQSTPDPTVLAAALGQRRILVTLDTDFGALLALSGAEQPSVILFRGEVTRRPEGQAMLLLANLAQITTDLTKGAAVVLGDDRVRVRRLPIEHEQRPSGG